MRTVDIKQTPLYDFHRANGARMVPFAGWNMPVQYTHGIKAEHLATRNGAGLFDVSHMVQIELSGSGADTFFERLTPTDIGAVAEGRVRYSLFLNDAGGVLDDLMVARLDGHLHLVVNAGRAQHDINHLRQNLDAETRIEVHHDKALLALQGPQAAAVMSSLGLDLDGLRFMDIRRFELNSIPLVITRSGYTGEDGFEISMLATAVVEIAKTLLATNEVTLAGLGARDTLRLEAGLPLWGHELDETITPTMAGLKFALSKKRREAADFPGADVILDEFAHGPKRCLVGLLATGARPVRDGTILLHDGAEVGVVTSGGFSPSLDRPAALGLVDAKLADTGTVITAATRGSETPMTVASLPLVPHRYFRG
ncbi:MAG: glycine cleavage system aminomethyltransferase GcvT [Candidatus Puniceispirillum sp.]|nr:glycine cleavage system aminomethyltransferase GcvT [Candidatus Puniceispirillum sp.]MBL6775226.1 glycine cleavage system aminomethyltransferase GcvT [Candidatus Puniceispirillum sp.]